MLKIIFSLLILILVSFAISSVNASEIDNGNITSESDLNLNNSIINDVDSINTLDSNNNPTIIVIAKDVSGENNTYNDKGYCAVNSTVEVFDSNNNLVYSGLTDTNGILTINSISIGTYTLKVSYLTYSPIICPLNLTSSSQSSTCNVTFIPDIALVMSYGNHKEKIDYLMNISKRVYYIDTMNVNVSNFWLLDYTNYIQLDMYSPDSYSVDISKYLKDTPANANYKVAYTFGTFNKDTINNIGLNFIGANSKNNTPNTIENTYIGSYFQAFDINNTDILHENINNLFAYICYLIDGVGTNPVLDSTKTPKLSASWGIYHTYYGKLEFVPSQNDINTWILANPGYNNDGVGSLNWMTYEYVEWQKINADPNIILNKFEEWYNSNKDLTTPYIIIASYYPGGNLVDALIKAYETKGRSVFNLYQSTTNPSMASLLETFCNSSTRGISGVNSLYAWSLDYANMENGGAIDEFSKMNIEIIRGLDDISQYSYLSDLGPQAEWTYGVTIPSFEGVYGAVVISYLDANGNQHVIIEGVNKLVEMTIGWATLKEKNNSDKKIAVVLYNYPPGKAEIGASYLDVFTSLHDLLIQLYDAGYDIGMDKSEIPSPEELYTLTAEFGNKGTWAQGLLNQYVEGHYSELMANNQLVNFTQYINYFNTLNKTLQDALVAKWGSSLGDIMVYNDTYIVIPGALFGNVFVTFQPSRGWEEVTDYHSATLPPHQQYVTFYKWLDESFGADVIINMGTHGTLEFLPGRSMGLQADDWTFALNNIPTIYPYIVSNPGEAMVAKDRLGALVISHMTPATVTSALYGNLIVLNNLIANYNQAIKNNATPLIDEYKESILKLVNESRDTLGLQLPKSGENFDTWLENIHQLLDELDNDVITLGLHTLGYALTGNELVQEINTIVSSKTQIYNLVMAMLYPNLVGNDYYDLLYSNQYKDELNKTQQYVIDLIAEVAINYYTINELAIKYNITSGSELYSCLELINETYYGIINNMEWKSILNALSGGFVLPGLAADPSYGDVLPTGKNVYSTDDTKMPTKEAWESAKKIVDTFLVQYYEQHGKFPELVGLVMWGTELLRTEGIGIGEFLYLLGVSPVWSKSGTVTGVSLMKLTSLTVTLTNGTVINRPRIDVYASIVTSNKNWISLMVNAVNLAFYNTTGESYSQNYLKKHYAENPSLDRLFGLPGNLLEGTGVSDLIPNTNKWQNFTDFNAELADIYLSRVSYSWTIDENGNVVISESRKDYEYLLSKVDLITQNIDSTWRFLDSDDYYDWFGGMLNAAQILGANPNTAVVDIRNQNNYISRDLQDELEFEIISTVLNPGYQEALLKSTGGWLSYSSKYQNIFAWSTVAGKYGSLSSSGNVFSKEIWDALANNALNVAGGVDADYKSVAMQSAIGWMVYAYEKGYWEADSATLEKLANKSIEMANQYGVACCHHTCGNLNFNQLMVKLSTLSNAQKQAYSDLLQAATLGAAVYSGSTQGGSTPDSGSTGSDTSGSSGSASVGDTSVQAMSSADSSGDSSSSTDSSSSDSSSDSSQSAGDSGSSNSYEINKNSGSNTSSDSSMPIQVIVCVIIIMIIFGFGYIKPKL